MSKNNPSNEKAVGTRIEQAPKKESRHAQAPTNLFNDTPKDEVSLNPTRVKVVKAFIDAYTERGAANMTSSSAKEAYKTFLKALDQTVTLTGSDLKECLQYLTAAMRDNANGAYNREAIFRFLPEVAKGERFELHRRLLNMALFYSKGDKSFFRQSVDVEFSVDKITNPQVRAQVAAYFNA